MISIIIRSHNDEKLIGRTIAAIMNQKPERELEILLADDASTDATREIAKQYPAVRVLPRPAGAYNPSKTLNAAAAAAKGDLVVFNNSDAIPLDDDWLDSLLAVFDDPETGAAYANQLPRPDAWPLVKKDTERAYGDGTEAKKWRHMFSMASSAARREVLLRHPFDERLQYSEDIEWSWRLKHNGIGVKYVPDARVEHSHNYSLKELKKRFYNEGKANGQIFPDKCRFVRAFGAMVVEMLRDFIYLVKNHKLTYFFPGLRFRWIQRMYAWRGEYDERRNRAL